MDIAAILALIAKAVTIITTLIQAGKDIMPALTALSNLVTKANNGVVSDEDLAATEALLDQQLAAFNEELPPE